MIDNLSLTEGFIPVTSRVKADKLFTLKQSLGKKKIAKVKDEILQKVNEEVKKVIEVKKIKVWF